MHVQRPQDGNMQHFITGLKFRFKLSFNDKLTSIQWVKMTL